MNIAPSNMEEAESHHIKNIEKLLFDVENKEDNEEKMSQQQQRQLRGNVLFGPGWQQNVSKNMHSKAFSDDFSKVEKIRKKKDEIKIKYLSTNTLEEEQLEEELQQEQKAERKEEEEYERKRE